MSEQQKTVSKKDIEYLREVHANITDFKMINVYNCPNYKDWELIQKKLDDNANKLVTAYEQGFISKWECFCGIIKAEV